LILNVTDILNTKFPEWKLKIFMPVDTFDVVLNSTTTMMFSMILLLILGFRPVCMNDDMLMGIVVHWLPGRLD
jgi:hypothetical protein